MELFNLEGAKRMILCPKCSHEQSNGTECESCGLIFQKYEQAQQRIKELGVASKDHAPENNGFPLSRIASVILLVIVTAAFTYYFAVERNKPQPANTQNPAIEGTAAGEKPSAPEVAAGPSQQKTGREMEPVAGTPIEHARDATVSIETKWGKGSGFFISKTAVVTNKHVIVPDRSQIEEIRHKVETGRKLIELEREKIAGLRNQLIRMTDGPSRQQLLIIIEEREKELSKVLPVQENAEVMLRSLEKANPYSDIKIILVDGTTLSAQSIQTSANHDLAILSVYPANAAVLRVAPKNSILHQGERVYTIGNPVGLRNTVTSGVFSGYRQNTVTNEILLQTDAPINPGNSGGPLIDEHGVVHGINTMIVRNTQGIGFAIPIQTVLDDFSIIQP